MDKFHQQLKRVIDLRDKLAWAQMTLQEEELRLGQLLKAVRSQQGKSLRVMAEEMGISHAYLSDIEQGKRRISPEILIKLRKVIE